MDALSTLSYYMSYTDEFPIVNIPSGVLHLICAIRDKMIGTPPPPQNEDFISLTQRKLDNWTHLQKAVAIFSIIGTIFLMKDMIENYFDLGYVTEMIDDRLGKPYEWKVIPQRLIDDSEWLRKAVTEKGVSFTALFKRAQETDRGDKVWIMGLIDKGIFEYSDFEFMTNALKNDRTIALKIINHTILNKERRNIYHGEKVFEKLPEALRNDIEIVRATYNRVKDDPFAYTYIIPFITYKSVYHHHDELALKALQEKKIQFEDLTHNQKQNYKFAVAAVKLNHRKWGELPVEMQRNAKFLEELKKFFEIGYNAIRVGAASLDLFGMKAAAEWVQAVFNDVEWFRQYRQKKAIESSTTSTQLVLSGEAAPFDEYFNR